MKKWHAINLLRWGNPDSIEWIKFVTCSSLVTNGFPRHTSKFTQTPLRKIGMTRLHRFLVPSSTYQHC